MTLSESIRSEHVLPLGWYPVIVFSPMLFLYWLVLLRVYEITGGMSIFLSNSSGLLVACGDSSIYHESSRIFRSNVRKKGANGSSRGVCLVDLPGLPTEEPIVSGRMPCTGGEPAVVSPDALARVLLVPLLRQERLVPLLHGSSGAARSLRAPGCCVLLVWSPLLSYAQRQVLRAGPTSAGTGG